LFVVIFSDGVTDGVVFIFFGLNSSDNHVLFNLFLSFQLFFGVFFMLLFDFFGFFSFNLDHNFSGFL